MQREHKIPFMTIYNYHGVALIELGMKSGIEPIFFEALFAGISIPRTIAERILTTINELKGTHYTLDTVAIAINEHVPSSRRNIEQERKQYAQNSTPLDS